MQPPAPAPRGRNQRRGLSAGVRVGATLTATGLAALLLLLPALLLNLPGLLHPLSSIAQAQVTRALLLLGGAQAVFAAVTLLPGILLLRRAHA